MVNTNKITIKVGNVTLDTNNIPKQGIDLKKLDEEAQRILSCFDQNGDKKLSRNEINRAISVFAAQDKTYTENANEKTLIIHKKDKELDSNELKNVKLQTNEEFLSVSDLIEHVLIKSESNELQESKEVKKYIKKHKLTNEGKEKAAELLNLEMVRNKAIESGNFKATESNLWLQDQKGFYYEFNGTGFTKRNGVYAVTAGDGYKIKVKTDNPNKYVHKACDGNGKIWTLQLKSADAKKTYINKEHVAKKIGLSNTGDDDIYKYKMPNGSIGYYSWQGNKFVLLDKGDDRSMIRQNNYYE